MRTDERMHLDCDDPMYCAVACYGDYMIDRFELVATLVVCLWLCAPVPARNIRAGCGGCAPRWCGCSGSLRVMQPVPYGGS